ncbi:class III poly(R)-hydroxyalkanoic acid synthase subunit PhaE [Luteimonas sp. SX5]|uniref:Poly(3-hydroxyalkanoate) polymerase subunit PhaE n=1 Tax=Luteimonas galliterrae TaxID=2940486 RepID=A0ABT0MG63_9GAMM|nr:class III poly(R)-hydroxyalkanoic acid synthase subunit PhaE [Luteimonas galliterrae]MCL1633860.1 class III poly(R)-hydroxyalkanoic acid synthase subunit PhaE [Luteimonas galliterrae]
MTQAGNAMPGDFEALAKQYWNAWSGMMRGAAAPGAAASGAQGWHEAIEGWSKLVHGGREEINVAVERFNAQARGWYGQMQQVAAQFAGQDSNAAEVARAWKQAMGAVGENPFPEMFRSMRGQGQQGLEQWIEDASPYLEAWRRESASWLGMPAFGFAREHQERWQKLARAQLDYQERNSAYNALMMRASQRAYELFEDKLLEREEPGRQITSARALFDLWIDAAEEAYADIALSPEFREVYGELVNAQMRLRNAFQKEVEQVNAMLGMPTRTEMDGAHRKIAELERALSRLRNAAGGQAKTQPPAEPAAKKTAAKSGQKPAPKRQNADAAAKRGNGKNAKGTRR